MVGFQARSVLAVALETRTVLVMIALAYGARPKSQRGISRSGGTPIASARALRNKRQCTGSSSTTL
jgi:hypothetical protein